MYSIAPTLETHLGLDPVLQLPGSGTLGKSFVSLSLSFAICTMGPIMRVAVGVKRDCTRERAWTVSHVCQVSHKGKFFPLCPQPCTLVADRGEGAGRTRAPVSRSASFPPSLLRS